MMTSAICFLKKRMNIKKNIMKYNAKKVLEIYQEYPNKTIKEVTEKYCEF